jgi:hypothetical protein
MYIPFLLQMGYAEEYVGGMEAVTLVVFLMRQYDRLQVYMMDTSDNSDI